MFVILGQSLVIEYHVYFLKKIFCATIVKNNKKVVELEDKKGELVLVSLKFSVVQTPMQQVLNCRSYYLPLFQVRRDC
jgi:hypothetical protein